MAFGTIYTHNPNPRSTAILAVARAQGIELDIVYADKTENPENYARLLQVNPLGQVPTLVGNDGHVLTECIAIALYITGQSDTTMLLGATRREFYEIVKWMSLVNADLLPAVGALILPLLGKGKPVNGPQDRGDCLRIIRRDCRLLDDHLRQPQHRYLVGAQMTLADLFVVGMLFGAVMVLHPLLRADYPRFWEWYYEVYETPMFKSVAGELRLLDIPMATVTGEAAE
ncbi:glutathione S-transferase family protein [Aspergillus fijiensis CBS 313.89]|uniref:Glutathione S-transferase n=1 Tax=Aspergillus fijiensis CBS 313.89 TaxID=1448319 RepID=A0A8G1RT70_9EURO|nr:glutathione S-transferase [Aspergillus fijiensis CBS 313.89]RAK79025.1 glutathione S-transferase [Aspergillus fijiensis CBS 313.89]